MNEQEYRERIECDMQEVDFGFPAQRIRDDIKSFEEDYGRSLYTIMKLAELEEMER